MDNTEKKIAIIGNNNTILGFKTIGVNAFPVNDKEDAVAALTKIKETDDYAIVFITEDWLDKLFNEVNELFGSNPLPAIVGIPSQKGSTGAGLKNLSHIVERAVGSDILNIDN